jgi:hypothetical protein
MNRYKYILNQSVANELQIGLFPYGTLIDPSLTDIKTETLTFFDISTEFFNKLKVKNISVVLFINQFKKHPVSFEDLQKFTEAVESHVRAQGVKVIGMYWAPGSETKDPFVPNPGMFYRVTENTGLKWDNIPEFILPYTNTLAKFTLAVIVKLICSMSLGPYSITTLYSALEKSPTDHLSNTVASGILTTVPVYDKFNPRLSLRVFFNPVKKN